MNNQLIMRSLPMVASVLGRKYGVKVEIAGNQAYTDGSTIHLPSLPLDSGDDFLKLVRGFLDHESAHIRHSDFDLLEGTAISPLTMSIFNMLEDFRVENALVKMYPGCRANFDWLIKFHFVHQLPIQRKDDVLLIADYILLSVRSWDVDEVKPNRDLVRKLIESKFGSLLVNLDKLLEEARISCDCTAACLDYACHIVKLLQDESKPVLANQQSPQGSDQSGSEQDNSQQTRSDGDSEDPESTKQGDTLGGANDSGGSGENQDAEPTGSNSQLDADSKEQLKKLLKSRPDELPGDMGKNIGDMLESAAPGTSTGLTVAVESEKPHRALSKGDLSMIRKATVALRSKLQSLMQTITLQRRSPGRRGKLDTRKLYKAGHDARIFQKHCEHRGIDTAVHILLDCSGSMRNRMHLASQSCFAVCDSLSHINGVSVGVTAFPANTVQQGKGGSTNKTVGTILRHGQRLHSEFAVNSSGNTPMGEALWWVMQQMHALTENRKLILIITDGEASNKANARQAIADGKAMGYETFGVGIMDSHIKDLLPDSSRVIQDIGELAPAMFNLLQNALIAKNH